MSELCYDEREEGEQGRKTGKRTLGLGVDVEPEGSSRSHSPPDRKGKIARMRKRRKETRARFRREDGFEGGEEEVEEGEDVDSFSCG